ncbi:tyrosine--tRNA ligase, mitochondrial [Trichomonascus vanleenenianus]|uniref:tyrosine--tRNA ligase MSY1 n=1 Tax=Trichomonascus vanleenenianus TaxID=2268995 RepID=UPI003ECB7E31
MLRRGITTLALASAKRTACRMAHVRSMTTGLTLNPDTEAPLVNHLTQRGLVSNVTSPELESLVAKEKVTLYLGADPTASSLHVGNMVPLMVLLHFFIRGHTAIALVGGATGEVGDPSGRTTERTQMKDDVRASNVQKIHAQMERFLQRGWDYAVARGYTEKGKTILENNANWWEGMSMLHFLGTYGRHIRVGHMLARDSVKSRLNSDQGIGFNEFTYQVLQAYDFWHLFKTYNCRLQLGGNDQWGNITAGTDLISRLRGHLKGDMAKNDAYGITVPLLTTPSGEKFGKSAGNAVWLDGELTKPYDLYQYFVKSPDSVVEDYLKLFTLLPIEEIAVIMEEHAKDESARVAQRTLAREVTDLVHGLGSGERAQLISAILFPSTEKSVEIPTAEEVLDAFEAEKLVKSASRSSILGAPWKTALSEVLGVTKSEAARLLKNGGIYYGIDRSPLKDASTVEAHHLTEDKLLLLRVGKSNYTIVRVH